MMRAWGVFLWDSLVLLLLSSSEDSLVRVVAAVCEGSP